VARHAIFLDILSKMNCRNASLHLHGNALRRERSWLLFWLTVSMSFHRL
jgi:hypothetical protein